LVDHVWQADGGSRITPMPLPPIPRCPPCPHTHRCVQGHGPVPAEYTAIGERPGKKENTIGIPFVGPAGQELDETYLPLAGLRREDIRVINTVRCGAVGNRKPTQKEIDACGGSHLPIEMEAGQPRVVFLMGATACKLAPEVDLEIQHGIPQSIAGVLQTYIPMYHPAAGMHRTALMTPMLEDWARVGRWLRGERVLPVDEGAVAYKEIDSKYDWQCYQDHHLRLKSAERHGGWVAVDTERHGPNAWSVRVSPAREAE